MLPALASHQGIETECFSGSPKAREEGAGKLHLPGAVGNDVLGGRLPRHARKVDAQHHVLDQDIKQTNTAC